ncbi:hypothetical protein FQN57_002045 [Myotisia sp. PD_48]|nr:hypothetical protein FQN57_002045 [Myotisia sp. PD_48]
MLGRLLNTAAATLNPSAYTTRNSNQLESVTEEEHTSGLLFPDVSLFQRSRTHAYPLQTSFVSPSASSAASFDDNGGLEIDALRDLRVIVAQNAIGDRDHPCILLDTQAPVVAAKPNRSALFERGEADKPRSKHTRTSSTASRSGAQPISHSLRSSVSDISQLSSPSDNDNGNSAFFRARNRRSTFSASVAEDDSTHGRTTRDLNELGLLNCIFGSSAFSYRGSSTKMHVVPSDGDVPFNLSSQHPRNHRRAETFSSHQSGATLPRKRLNGSMMQPSPTRVTVLVTRMFSVHLPEQSGVSEQSGNRTSLTGSFNEHEDQFCAGRKPRKIKEKKTPMYAVAITIQLPVATKPGGRPFAQRNSAQTGALKPSGFLSGSLDSHQTVISTFDGGSFSSTSSNIDDRIDLLMDYWDVIARTLSRLEKLARAEILKLLQLTVQQLALQPKPSMGPYMQRTNQTIVQLSPDALARNQLLCEEMLHATQRVCLALKIPPVVTGQSRWGVWREEARWIARSLSEKEHNFFFLVLITAFLGNHTEWLSFLGPDWYRRRHTMQQKAQYDNEMSISNRTVIISADKMAARRLIFVLSAFLPPQQRIDPLASPLRPGTSASFRQVSQSPPSASVARQESLRRTINRRARNRQFTDECNIPKRSGSVSSNEASNSNHDELDFGKNSIAYPRRDSDARSFRNSSLSIPAGGTVGAMKTGTVSTATAAPGTATPVPHFSPHHANLRAGADGNSQTQSDITSPASAILLQSLRKSEISSTAPGNERPVSKKWGGLLSGLWNTRETPAGKPIPPIDTGKHSNQPDPAKAQTSDFTRSAGVGEVINEDDVLLSDGVEPSSTSSPNSESPKVKASTVIPPSQYPSSPVKLCVEANDGIVDVEVPLPGFLSLSSSNDSTLTSPRKARTSITSLDCDVSCSNTAPWIHGNHKDFDGPSVNVAGWLKHYHEDFTLQAVHPYPALEAAIKKSMSAEPTPCSVNSGISSYFDKGTEKWVDVCSTLIADTRTFTVKRIRLRRKISTIDDRMTLSQPNSQAVSPGSIANQPLGSLPDGSKVSTPTPLRRVESTIVEEEFVEEPIMDLDGTLVDAVERVLACSGPSSALQSRAPSPNRSRRGKTANSFDAYRKNAENATRRDQPSIEVPRNECRRMVLGALDEVVRSVTAEHRQEELTLDSDNVSKYPSYGRKKLSSMAENTLREGIRKWLQDIDETC